MISRGVGSGIAGNDCNLLLIDDPIKNSAEADSLTMRDNLWEEWLSVYKGRLAPNAKVIIITTRWHMDDIVGRILQTEHNVKYINFPVECLEESDILGRKKGDALFPELGKDNKWLADFRISYQNEQGSRAWTTSFLGQPTNVDGNIFKRRWFNKYTGHVQTAYKAISIDASFKGDKDNDFVSIQVWGKIDQKYYLLDRYKARMGFVDTIAVVNRIIARHMDYNVIYVEDKANGSAIVDVLHRRYQGVIPVNPEGGKVARAYAVQPLFESGCVHIRQDIDKDFEDEMCNFPEGVNDDDVDACTQALNRLREIVAKLSYVDPDKWDEEDQLNDVLGYR
jgi:predicted phage terminase large subunit-like protein